jgi:hypothetical protein
METVDMNEFQNEFEVMGVIAQKCGGNPLYDEDGKVYLYTFTPFELLRFADFLVTTTLDNYEEIQNTPKV